MQKLGIIGAGAWGTALAAVAAKAGRDVTLWAFEPEVVEAINRTRRNPLYLPEIVLSDLIRATSNLNAMAGLDILLVVTPAQHMRAILAKMPAHPRDLVLCSKGIDAASGALRFAAELRHAHRLRGLPRHILYGVQP